ncbi:MAG: phenylalanine--tRNA ligase subunit beta, partial [Chloroflexota bacterium]|nr:phenylalanine--tRNA ligase subunit beta [Chloroflexota bacterium]
AVSVRRTSVELGLRTDASSRFEKGLDAQLTVVGTNRAAQLMTELAGAIVHPGIVDCYPEPVHPRTIPFSPSEVEWLTAVKVTPHEVVDSLTALGFGVETDEMGKAMAVTVPTYRADVTEGADLVEEVVRLIGYDKIPSTIPVGPLPEPQLESWFDREQEVRTLLVGAGLNEIVTYAMTSRARMVNLLAQADALSARALLSGAKHSKPATPHGLALPRSASTALVPFDVQSIPAVVLSNPLTTDLEVMRLTLMSGLLETLQENSKRNKADLRFFEIGRRYLPTSEANSLPLELRSVGIVLCGPAAVSWIAELSRPADFYDLKGVVEILLNGLHITRSRFTPTQHPTFHPGRCALIELPRHSQDGEEIFSPVGVLGEVHPVVQQRYDLPYRTYLCEINLEMLYEAVPDQLTYTPTSRHQELSRDLALVVDRAVPAQDISDEISQSGGELLRSVTLFDVYTGEPIPVGKKNLTYSLVYQAQDRTLTDTEANTLQERIIHSLNEKFGATLR